ncbi:MAG: aldo/keto reductase [Pseudomonadota bacterium]
MEKRRLGRTDIDVSVLCLGTMMYGDQIGEADAFAQMDYALERGVDFFDTAELYTIPPKPETQGDSERIVGRWMKARGVRDKIVLATKVTGRSSRLNWVRRDGRLPRVCATDMREALEDSLERLQTDYIDLYQIHWPDRNVPLFGADVKGYEHYEDDFAAFEDTLDVMQKFQNEGKIRHFGLSNETSWGVMRFVAQCEARGLVRPQSIQNAYHLANRYFEYGLAEIAMQEQVGLLAYSPLGQGTLTGKYLDGALPKGSRGEMFGGRLWRYETPSTDDAIKAYTHVAKDFDIDIAQMALQFVTTRPWVTSNIFGASSLAQLETNINSINVTWTKELDEAVNAVHARLPNPCP